jgi:hypothetical protein
MKVKINSKFTVTLYNKDSVLYNVSEHNTLSAEYKTLLQDLLTTGSSIRSYYYSYSFTYYPPSNIYVVLVNNGIVVARIPVKLDKFHEYVNTISTTGCKNNLTSCNLNGLSFSIKYTASDETNDTYTFDEIQIWADNEYMIAYAVIGTVTKQSNSFISVTWDADVTIESNGVLYMPGCTDLSFTYDYNLNLAGYQPFLCVNLPYIIVALTLIPYDLIPQDTFLYQQVNNLLQVLGISASGSASPVQNLNFQGVTYYVINNVAYPINQPYIIYNTQQSNTVSLFLLYGINDNNFIYSTTLTSTLQYFKPYIPMLIINVIEE